jgi:transposase
VSELCGASLKANVPSRSVARDLGVHNEALRLWVRQAQADADSRQGRLTTVEREDIAAYCW